MILFRASFVVMVSVFLRRDQRVVGAPVFEKETDGELLKPDTNSQDEINFIGGISIPGEPSESKTKEAGTEASGDNAFANFNPNNTITYSSSNILPNDTPYDMIFIPSSEVPSDIERSDLPSDLSDDEFDKTIAGKIEEEQLGPVSMASDSDYDEYYSYIGDWRDLSWLTEFSDDSQEDDNFENTLLGSDDTDNRFEAPSLNYASFGLKDVEESEEEDEKKKNGIDGYEKTIDAVKTRKRRSLEGFDVSEEEDEEEQEENVLEEINESSLSSSFYDASFISSESSDVLSSVSEDVSELDEGFNEVDPKRAEMEKVLARYPRPGDLGNWKNDMNDIQFYDGDKREKRAIDLFKYYTVNFPTLEGMRKRGNEEFAAPFDFDDIANDLVPSSSKTKRSLQTSRLDNDEWNTLDESFDSSNYDLDTLDSEEQSDELNNDIYMPEVIDNSKEFGQFLSHVVSVPPEFENRRGHRFDIPDYNEGKYFAYRSANLNPLSRTVPVDNSPDVPDPADLLKLYRIIQELNQRDIIAARKPRMYLPGPHAGYQAYGNEIHRGMFGSKRSPLQKALINPLPIGLKLPNPSNSDEILNTIDQYRYLESDVSSNAEDEIDKGNDVATVNLNKA